MKYVTRVLVWPPGTARPIRNPPATHRDPEETTMPTATAAALRQQMVDKRAEHRAHIRRTGEDLPKIRNWTWPGRS
jgi:hypothetical protein